MFRMVPYSPAPIRSHVLQIVVVELYREVVDEGADDPAHVRHHPRDPEEIVGRGEGLVAEAGHQG